jgi:hypothetical protein
MNKQREQKLVTLARIMAMTQDLTGYVQPVDRLPNKELIATVESNRMPLTEEELLTLSTFSGKEKKAYVKTLKEKYGR